MSDHDRPGKYVVGEALTFWNLDKKSSMRYLLHRSDFKDEDFQYLVKQRMYKKDQSYLWISNCYKEIEKDTLIKWQAEREFFKKTMSQCEDLKKHYASLEKFFERLEDIDSQLEKLTDDEEEITEAHEANKVLIADLDRKYNKNESEMSQLAGELEEERRLLYLCKVYQAGEEKRNEIKEALSINVDQLAAIKHKTSLLNDQKTMMAQVVDDLNIEKKDYEKIRPSFFDRFFRRKKAQAWNDRFKEIIDESSTKKRALRAVKRDMLALEKQLKIANNRNEKLHKSRDNQEAICQKNKEAWSAASNDKAVNIELLNETITRLSKSIKNNREYTANLIQDRNKAKSALAEQQSIYNSVITKKSVLDSEKSQILSEIKQICSDHFEGCEQNYPDSDYWAESNSVLQKTSPWISQKMQTLRETLFWSGIRLHKYFIILSRKSLSSNITALRRLLLYNDLPTAHYSDIRSLWASLFLIVPLVSSTFASFQRLFRHLEQEEIGWLMIDEAGQTSPHCAVGAIWRASRVIVVGDPFQVEPIVTLPKALASKLADYYRVSPVYDVISQSVQTLSDLNSYNKCITFVCG